MTSNSATAFYPRRLYGDVAMAGVGITMSKVSTHSHVIPKRAKGESPHRSWLHLDCS